MHAMVMTTVDARMPAGLDATVSRSDTARLGHPHRGSRDSRSQHRIDGQAPGGQRQLHQYQQHAQPAHTEGAVAQSTEQGQ